jgi:hypothetical protein
MHEGLGDPKYRPCPLLIKMVDAVGWEENPAKVSMITVKRRLFGGQELCLLAIVINI